jgi:hypothetical protein
LAQFKVEIVLQCLGAFQWKIVWRKQINIFKIIFSELLTNQSSKKYFAKIYYQNNIKA